MFYYNYYKRKSEGMRRRRYKRYRRKFRPRYKPRPKRRRSLEEIKFYAGLIFIIIGVALLLVGYLLERMAIGIVTDFFTLASFGIIFLFIGGVILTTRRRTVETLTKRRETW